MSQFKPHMDILPPAQQRLWPELRPSIELGLVLYGGTAIGLRLGHRPSIDFDFFTDKPLSKTTLDESFPFLKRSRVLQERPNTLSVLAGGLGSGDAEVKISFFGNLDLGRVGEPQVTEDAVLAVASLDDLMATKLKVILQRIEAKDYRDIAAMVEVGVPLERGLAGAAQIYGPAFQPSECLKALVFFEGGDLNSLTQKERETLIFASQRVRDLPALTLIRGLSTGTLD
jgi:hypothetical protein